MSSLNSALKGSRGLTQKFIAMEVVEWGNLLLKKNADYGSIIFDAPILLPNLNPKDAILVRMSDKIGRLITLMDNDAEVNESIEDTLRDLGAYCLLEVVRRRLQTQTQVVAEGS